MALTYTTTGVSPAGVARLPSLQLQRYDISESFLELSESIV